MSNNEKKQGQEWQDDNMEGLYENDIAYYNTTMGLIESVGADIEQANEYTRFFKRHLRGTYYDIIETIYKSRLNGRSDITILDVGCGTGTDLFELSERLKFKSMVGVELSGSAVKYANGAAKPDMRFICGRVEDLINENERYDLIVNFTMLEHVADPVDTIGSCAHLLKTKGYLVSVVPNCRYNAYFWNLPQYLYHKLTKRVFPTHCVSTHIAKSAHRQAGLNLQAYHVYGFRPPQAWFAHVPANRINAFTRWLEEIDRVFRSTWLEPFLYLEVYVGAFGEETIAFPQWERHRDLRWFPTLIATLPLVFRVWWTYGLRSILNEITTGLVCLICPNWMLRVMNRITKGN